VHTCRRASIRLPADHTDDTLALTAIREMDVF